MRKKFTIAGVISLLVLLASFYYLSPGRAPEGQAPLTSLDPGNFHQFRRQFNSAQSTVRILLLLSPT